MIKTTKTTSKHQLKVMKIQHDYHLLSPSLSLINKIDTDLLFKPIWMTFLLYVSLQGDPLGWYKTFPRNKEEIICLLWHLLTKTPHPCHPICGLTCWMMNLLNFPPQDKKKIHYGMDILRPKNAIILKHFQMHSHHDKVSISFNILLQLVPKGQNDNNTSEVAVVMV